MISFSELTWLKERDSEPPVYLGEEDSVGEEEAVDDDLDHDDGQDEYDPPASLWVVVLEDAGDPPLPVHGAVGHNAVLSLLKRQNLDFYF